MRATTAVSATARARPASAPRRPTRRPATNTVHLIVTDNAGASHSAATAAMAAPTALDATALSSSRIRLTWRDNPTGETGFKIERSRTAAGGFTQIATVGRGVTTFTDTGRASRTTYYYRVRACGGDSAYSKVDGARTF